MQNNIHKLVAKQKRKKAIKNAALKPFKLNWYNIAIITLLYMIWEKLP